MNEKNKRLVVKDNALINSSYNLSLTEQRLMLLAITEARELKELTPDTGVTIYATTYADQYDIDNANVYRDLNAAMIQLFNRQFSFKVIDEDGEEGITISRWINEASYYDGKGKIVLYLNKYVIEMISRLEANFTKYLLIQVSDFKSKYSIRLFELISQYSEVSNSRLYTIAELREILGLEETEYKTMGLFKVNVLDKAVKEINEKTDIKLKYDQKKNGRAISHILFKISKKKERNTNTGRDKDTVDMFTGMTDKQAKMFADKLSKDSNFQSFFMADAGESIEKYASRIKDKLLDDFYIKAWMSYLKAVGYIPRNK